MQNWTIPLISLAENSEAAVSTVTGRLTASGLGVVRSFDLRSACAAYPNQACPHHGQSECDCQLVVLLVFDPLEQPASVILHTCNGETQVGLAASPIQQPSPRFEKRLRKILQRPKSAIPLRELQP